MKTKGPHDASADGGPQRPKKGRGGPGGGGPGGGGPGGDPAAMLGMMMERMDQNKDGKLEESELADIARGECAADEGGRHQRRLRLSTVPS